MIISNKLQCSPCKLTSLGYRCNYKVNFTFVNKSKSFHTTLGIHKLEFDCYLSLSYTWVETDKRQVV